MSRTQGQTVKRRAENAHAPVTTTRQATATTCTLSSYLGSDPQHVPRLTLGMTTPGAICTVLPMGATATATEDAVAEAACTCTTTKRAESENMVRGGVWCSTSQIVQRTAGPWFDVLQHSRDGAARRSGFILFYSQIIHYCGRLHKRLKKPLHKVQTTNALPLSNSTTPQMSSPAAKKAKTMVRCHTVASGDLLPPCCWWQDVTQAPALQGPLNNCCARVRRSTPLYSAGCIAVARTSRYVSVVQSGDGACRQVPVCHPAPHNRCHRIFVALAKARAKKKTEQSVASAHTTSPGVCRQRWPDHVCVLCDVCRAVLQRWGVCRKGKLRSGVPSCPSSTRSVPLALTVIDLATIGPPSPLAVV